jgi:predicted HTH transcriptional regulator
MTPIELLDIVSAGETSRVQFKENITALDEFAKEMIAMANTLGGDILVGIRDKTGQVLGLSQQQLHEANQKVGNLATNNIEGPVFVTTEIVTVENNGPKRVLVVHVPEGTNKPYKDQKGGIYVKQGSDKRRLIDNNEIRRLFQSSRNLTADEEEVFDTSTADIDQHAFEEYFQREFERSYAEMGLNFEEALRRKRILRDGKLTLAGLLFFGRDPQVFKPAFHIKAVSYFGRDIGGTAYRDSRDIMGTIPRQFTGAMSFLMANLRQLQAGQDFNSTGQPEIARVALEEIVQNALLHRDYYKNAPVRILVFDDRVEIISPGRLPNSLTVPEIKFGNPVIRNNQLVAFGSRLMPYRGLGSGISRALDAHPGLDFVNDIDGEQFVAIFPRPE